MDSTAKESPDSVKEGPVLVAINLAEASELVELYKVGPALAKRIISYREAHGPFEGPDDLSRVDGVSADLAMLLSPHIDWRSPSQEDVQLSRSLTGFVCSLGVCAIGIWFTYYALRMLLTLLPVDGPVGLIRSWRTASGLALSVCLTVGFSFKARSALTRSAKSLERYQRAEDRVLLFGMGAGLSAGAATVAEFLARLENWRALPQSPGALALVSGALVSLGMWGPVLLVAVHPRLARNRVLSIIMHASFVTAGVALGVAAWFTRKQIHPTVLFLAAAMGVFTIWAGILILRGASPLSYLIEGALGRWESDSDNLWLRWINIRLPDPEQQQALLAALGRAHPPSRWRTLGGALIVGIGVWLLLGTAGAVLEWIIQGWLDAAIGRR
jgi:competence ComEA-like helix-hairpin-helix protein